MLENPPPYTYTEFVISICAGESLAGGLKVTEHLDYSHPPHTHTYAPNETRFPNPKFSSTKHLESDFSEPDKNVHSI